MADELPVTINFLRKRGDTKPFRFPITTAAGVAQSLAGFTLHMTANPEKDPTDDSAHSFVIVGAEDGTGTASFTPTPAQVDIVGSVYYDAQLIDGDDLIFTFAEGKIKFTQDITKVEP
tara:strand:+ start:41921 stop:42274 length:354 start_codon:yes stop_codon:yes gene_type:complete